MTLRYRIKLILGITVDPPSDTLWTATASYKHSGAGRLSFWVSKVELTSAGTAKIFVHRMAGFNGAVSCTIQTFDCGGDFSTTAGVDYTAVNSVISFADGEVGIKSVDVVVNAFPRVGLSLIGVRMVTATGGAEKAIREWKK